MQISLSPDSDPNDASTVSLIVEGEVDAHNCADFRAELLKLAQPPDGNDVAVRPTVALDMSKVSFIDSSGVSELLRVGRKLDEEGSGLQLSAASPPVARVLELTGLAEHLGLT
jgi:anti-sigma B factor antagonist